MEFVDDRVPEGMEVVNAVVVWKGEVVSTSISVGEVFVNSGGGMEWLMDISNIMD